MSSATSDVSSKLLTWLMAGIGTLLTYSAFRNRSPLDVLRDIDGPPLAQPTGQTDDAGYPGGGGAGYTSDIARLRMLANREIEPELVSIQPNGKMDKAAAASLERIFTKVGYVVPNVGASRTFAEQASLYASDPKRFAPPNKSLHVVGLAIDVHASYVNRPEVISAFTSEGWHRARSDEPWHWSYGVRG